MRILISQHVEHLRKPPIKILKINFFFTVQRLYHQVSFGWCKEINNLAIATTLNSTDILLFCLFDKID